MKKPVQDPCIEWASVVTSSRLYTVPYASADATRCITSYHRQSNHYSMGGNQPREVAQLHRK